MTTIDLKKELEELDQRLTRVRQFVVSVLQDTTYFKEVDLLKLSHDQIVTLARSIIEIEERLGDKSRQVSPQAFTRKAGQSY